MTTRFVLLHHKGGILILNTHWIEQVFENSEGVAVIETRGDSGGLYEVDEPIDVVVRRLDLATQ